MQLVAEVDTPGTKVTKIISPHDDGIEMWVYICPRNKNHYYSAPDWSPRNVTLHQTQRHRNGSSGELEDGEPRINCPYCHVARVPHLVKELIPFREMP